MKNVKGFCKDFRINQLKLTLQDVEYKTGVLVKTLSAFENDRSSNINHLNIYYSLCQDIRQRRKFITGLYKAMELDRGLSN